MQNRGEEGMEKLSYDNTLRCLRSLEKLKIFINCKRKIPCMSSSLIDPGPLEVTFSECAFLNRNKSLELDFLLNEAVKKIDSIQEDFLLHINSVRTNDL